MLAQTDNPESDIRRLLVDALRRPAGIVELSHADLDLLVRMLRAVRLHGRVCADVQQAGVFDALPDVIKDQLQSALNMAIARSRVAAWELDSIERVSSSRPELELVVMKGCAYELLRTPNCRGRIFADVDLLVAKDDLVDVERMLNDRGWKTQELSPYDDNYYRRWTHELPPLMHVEREVEIDLHHTILPTTSRLKPSGRRLLDASIAVAGRRYRVLAPPDLVLHAIVHLVVDSDFADKLRDLVDVDDLLRYFDERDATFWKQFTSRATELGLRRPAFYGLRYCRAVLGTPIPDDVWQEVAPWGPLPPLRWVMDKLIPEALFPLRPERPNRRARFARLLLYMRSHWIRMPPWLLAYHLSYKFMITRIRRSS